MTDLEQSSSDCGKNQCCLLKNVEKVACVALREAVSSENQDGKKFISGTSAVRNLKSTARMVLKRLQQIRSVTES